MAEPFEELRIKANSIKQITGSKPSVFLATMGSLKEYKGRADFSRNFFEVGGFEVNYPNGFDSCDVAVDTIINSNAKIIVICSTDEKYTAVVPELTNKLKAYKKEITIVLAGYPKDKIEEYKNSGVDEFIYLGADAYSILERLISNYK